MKKKKTPQLFIGTSGWKYPHWKGNFYPRDLKAREEFGYYCSLFDTVELNNPFYRSPSAPTFERWEKEAPENFLYSVKANRFFTHLKKLNVKRMNILNFLDKAQNLKKKLGPFMFQLPPRWKKNIPRLETFLKKLPGKYRYSIEFRDNSWMDEELYICLRKHHIAFCIYELAGYISPLSVTADFVYIRLHGPGAKYSGSYSVQKLTKWANFCKQQLAGGKDVYLYFDNDEKAYAAKNALRLKTLINEMA